MKREELDKIINEYYTDNHKKLTNIAESILVKRLQKSVATDHQLVDTLVNSSYIYIIDNIKAIKPFIVKGKIQSVIINFMYNEVNWRKSNFKSAFTKTHNIVELKEDLLIETEIEEELELRLERELETQDQLAHLDGKIAELSAVQRRLFNLYIVGEYNSVTRLSEYTKIPRSSAYNAIVKLKKFLKQNYKE